MKKIFLGIVLILASTFIACEDVEEIQRQGTAVSGTMFSVSIAAPENFTNDIEFTVFESGPESESRITASQDDANRWLSSNPRNTIINIKPQRSGWQFGAEEDIREVYLQWVSTKGEEILDELRRVCFEDSSAVAFQDYTYAGILEGAKITSDRVLFGREPGADLGDKFYVEPGYGTSLTILASYPSYHIVYNGYTDSTPLTFSDVFAPGNAMLNPNRNMLLSFAEIPAEPLDEVTFDVEIPFECEYFQPMFYGRDYSSDFYEKNMIVPNENRVLHGSVTVKFE